jgi:4-amino-4-deoxy-L-arabinose transferase-like glycosyltransferase
VVALLLAVGSRYGFHRDEMYFVAAGRRLDWGYVDQPPLVPAIARGVEEITGAVSPWTLRVAPALAVGAVALIAALAARRFGAGKAGQVYAAFALGWAGVVVGEGHLLSTAIFDFLFWAVSLALVAALLDGADPRLWLVLGATVGVGLQNKHTIGIMAVAMFVGLVASRRDVLRSAWPWTGVALAAALALPNLVWQAVHGWPQLEMARALADRSEGPLAFVVFQPLLLSVATTVPAIAGLWWLVRAAEARPWRPLAVMYGFLFVFFLATGGKAYYIAPVYAVLVPAGARWFEQLGTAARRWLVAVTAAGLAIGLVIALPLVPVDMVANVDLTGELGETVGWPELIDQIAAVQVDALTGAVVFTASYGEAGAVELLGPAAGLPPAWSGHNSYWSWGPPPTHGAVIGVGHVAPVLASICADVEQVATISNPYGVENEEAGLPIYLCDRPFRQLSVVWDRARHYN